MLESRENSKNLNHWHTTATATAMNKTWLETEVEVEYIPEEELIQ